MVHLELVDHDEIFNQLKYPPIIINDIDPTLQDEKERLNNLLYTRYDGDTLDVMPSCDCGSVKGATEAGVRCGDCGTLCASVTEKPLESMLWIAAPKGVAGLINPMVWSILSAALKKDGCQIMDWLCNPMYQPTSERGKATAAKLEMLNIPRGLNAFIENFDEIINLLFDNRMVKGSVRVRQEYRQFIDENKHKFFPKHIPIPSRIGFIIESTSSGMYTDTSMALAMDAIRTISSINTTIHPMKLKNLEYRATRAVSQLAAYYRSFFVDSLGKKTGWLRKHVFGSRLHFTARAVISSLSENHDYDECHLPWVVAVQLLKVHLSAKLLKRGYTPREIDNLFYKYAMRYHPLLDELFDELIAESPHKGIPILLQRNPTLQRGSAQQLFVTKIKKDPKIYTISMSVLCLKAPNAD